MFASFGPYTRPFAGEPFQYTQLPICRCIIYSRTIVGTCSMQISTLIQQPIHNFDIACDFHASKPCRCWDHGFLNNWQSCVHRLLGTRSTPSSWHCFVMQLRMMQPQIEPPIAITGTFVDLSTDHLGHLAATACDGVEQLAPFPLGPAPQFRSSAAIS